jgi:hypothetical protein
MSRVTTIIKTLEPSDTTFLPFLFINPQFGYSVDSIIRDVHTTPKVFLKADAFPYNIQEYYWIQEGVTGKKSWYALGLLEDNIYFLYRAYTNTGFENGGHMDLWVSYSFSDIIQYAMDASVYDTYITSSQGATSSQGVTSNQGVTSSQNTIPDVSISEPSVN